ncbi:hypothetical protein [Dethiothermospora halolimnae]
MKKKPILITKEKLDKKIGVGSIALSFVIDKGGNIKMDGVVISPSKTN